MVRFMLREQPHVAALGAASLYEFHRAADQRLWEILAVAMGLVCVVTAGPKAHDRDACLKLIGTEVAH